MALVLSSLKLLIPPPVVALIGAALMVKLAWLTPHWRVELPGRLMLGAIVALAGLALMVSAARALRRAQTTLSPLRPHKTSTLVTSGIYARSRNPIYLGLVLALVGLALAMANPLTLVGPLLVGLYLDRFQIRPEEHVLNERLRGAWVNYCDRTRRWL